MKIQGMMNRLIYWLCEEIMFVMIYQCHHCCVLLFVRRQHNLKKNIFVRESTLSPIQKTVVLLLERNPKNTKFHGIKRLLGWYHLEGYGQIHVSHSDVINSEQINWNSPD